MDYGLIDKILEEQERIPVYKMFYHYPGASREEIEELIEIKKLIIKDGYVEKRRNPIV